MGEKKQALLEKRNMKPNETYIKLFVLLSTLGLVTSAYLVKDHYSAQKSFCDMGTRISCQVINKSAFAKLLNVPVAVFGVTWFLGQLWSALKLWDSERDTALWSQTLLLYTGSGVLFALYLIIAEVILGAICPLCTVVHAIVGLQLWLAWQLYSRPGFPFLPVPSLIRAQQGLILALAVIHIVPLIYFNTLAPVEPTGLPTAPTDEVTSFADCLAKEGVAMYGAKSCAFCQRQKDLFGPAFDHVTYVDCGTEISRCQSHNITGLPTWIRETGNPPKETGRQTGMRTFKELSTLSGGKCQLVTPT